MRRRLLEQKHRALLKTREAAEQKLEAAERKLVSRGVLRLRARNQLRAEIDLQRRAVDLADERLTETAALLDESKLTIRRPARTSDHRGAGA